MFRQVLRWVPRAGTRFQPLRPQRRTLAKIPSLPEEVPLSVPSGFGDYSLILPANFALEGVAHIKPRTVPPHIKRPYYAVETSEPSEAKEEPASSERQVPYSETPEQPKTDAMIVLGSEDEAALRRSCELAKKTLEFARILVQVGATTESIDAAIHDYIIEKGAYPSPLLYSGYPKSCCTSVNNIMAHGIPDDRPLEDGDIVNVDITVYLDGFHGDTSRTYLVGNVDKEGRELVDVTSEALYRAIDVCKPGTPFKLIGSTIQDYAHSLGYSVSTAFSGHGIGRTFHTPPWILHHANDEPGIMQPGHCFTIEPCLVQGSRPQGWMFPDGWTVSTETGARSAQQEHTVLITETGVDVLTK